MAAALEVERVDEVVVERHADEELPLADPHEPLLLVEAVGAEILSVDADLRTRLIKHEMDKRAFMLTLRRSQLEAKSNQGPSAATSIFKNVGARITQDRAELAIEIMGMNGLGWEGEGFSEQELEQTRTWLWGKAVSIYGGSSEIQNNVIAKRILGMLDHQ